ncbi:hypothetical protein CaCOL14_009538 [Colletotrichum acutatum]
MGRETFLVQVDWVDDWPIFNKGRNITLQTVGREDIRKAAAADADGVKWKADLSRSSLEIGWYHKSEWESPSTRAEADFILLDTPIKPCHSLIERPGCLRLYGNCFDLNSPESPAMILRKQTSYSEGFKATMLFKPSRAGYESGVTVWWSQYSYATIGIGAVQPQDGGSAVPTIITREPTGKVNKLKVAHPLLDSAIPALNLNQPVKLSITARSSDYEMSLSVDGITTTKIFKSEALTVFPPVGGAFCGVMYGIYSFGQSEPVLDPSDFTEIEILEI